jgi:hypothetical protein
MASIFEERFSMGKVYPLWLEKLIFYSLIGAAIWVGITLQNYLDGGLLWVARICLLPILVFVITELFGRNIQKVYLNRYCHY